MLASFTMVFGYSWYLFIDECILSGISVRAVSARFHNLPRHGHIGCSLGGSSNKSESLHLDTRCVAGGTLKVK